VPGRHAAGNAHQNAECRESNAVADRRVLKASEGMEFAGESRAENVRLGAADARPSGIRPSGEEAARSDPRLLSKVTGLSLAQITRLIRAYRETGVVEAKGIPRRACDQYKRADIALLAEVDRAHERLSGPATQRILKREHGEFGQEKFARLRRSPFRTCTTCVTVPPTGRWRRVRGDASQPGVYRRTSAAGARTGGLIPACGHGTQGTGTTRKACTTSTPSTRSRNGNGGLRSRITEQFLLPVLEAILHQFPFRIWVFHSDNGSEYINHQMAEMLEKLLAEFTNRGQTAARTTPWWKARTGGDSASSWAMATFPASIPSRCKSSIWRT